MRFARIRLHGHPADSLLLVACFILSKVVVQRILFKPHRIVAATHYPKEDLDPSFKENCIVTGYYIIAHLTEIVSNAYEDILKWKGDFHKAIEIHEKVFRYLLPVNSDGFKY